jgi:hypothetical protein
MFLPQTPIAFVRFKVLTAASMMFRVVFWDILPCKMIVDRRFRGAYWLHHQGTSVDNHFTREYIPEDTSEHPIAFVLEVDIFMSFNVFITIDMSMI